MPLDLQLRTPAYPWRILCCAVALLAVFAHNIRAEEIQPADAPPDAVAAQLQGWLGEPAAAEPPFSLYQAEACRRFYAQRTYRPAWTAAGQPGTNIDILLRTLEDAAREGLRPADYHVAAIRQARLTRSDEARARASLDLLLSDAFLHYAHDLQTGRINPRDLDRDWAIAPIVHADTVAALEEALVNGHLAPALVALAPTQHEYQELRDALDYHRQLASQGGWTGVDPGEKLEPGAVSPRVEQLRQRLRVTGELAADPIGDTPADPRHYDPALVAAVQDFQFRHGLETDGVVGKRTLAALNVGVDERIRQIEVNMERWRWLPRALEPRHIVVNMMNYSLDVVENNRSVLNMRVIVGQQYRSTPVIGSQITHVVLNPYWNVPTSIAGKDLLPKVRRDPGFFDHLGIKVFAGWGNGAQQLNPATIDWSSISSRRFPYKLRQDPGPKNSLGRIKFLLPNNYDIYLHDTPNRALFQRAERAFSSGCIRLEKPHELALYLLDGKGEWDAETLQAAIDGMQTRTLRLPEAVPIYLQYQTAWVDDGERVQFRHDLYGRDERLAKALRYSGTELASKM